MVRRVRKTRRNLGGVNWRSLLSKAHRYAKDNKLASRGLRALNFNRAADIASILGYGKSAGGRRRKYRRRRARGNGFWDVVKGIGKVATNVASVIPHPYAQVGSQVGKAIGLGKAKGRGRRIGGGLSGNRVVNPYILL